MMIYNMMIYTMYNIYIYILNLYAIDIIDALMAFQAEVVQYIVQSEAGFYMKGVRLTSGAVQKMSYYFAAFTFSRPAQCYISKGPRNERRLLRAARGLFARFWGGS